MELFDTLLPLFLEQINPTFAAECTESCLTCLKYFMMNQEKVSQIESLLVGKLQDLSYLLLHKQQEIRELTLEVLCFLSDQKMSTKLAIVSY